MLMYAIVPAYHPTRQMAGQVQDSKGAGRSKRCWQSVILTCDGSHGRDEMCLVVLWKWRLCDLRLVVVDRGSQTHDDQSDVGDEMELCRTVRRHGCLDVPVDIMSWLLFLENICARRAADCCLLF